MPCAMASRAPGLKPPPMTRLRLGLCWSMRAVRRSVVVGLRGLTPALVETEGPTPGAIAPSPTHTAMAVGGVPGAAGAGVAGGGKGIGIGTTEVVVLDTAWEGIWCSSGCAGPLSFFPLCPCTPVLANGSVFATVTTVT